MFQRGSHPDRRDALPWAGAHSHPYLSVERCSGLVYCGVVDSD